MSEFLSADNLCRGIGKTSLSQLEDALRESTRRVFQKRRHGDHNKWEEVMRFLPNVEPSEVYLCNDTVTLGSKTDCSDEHRKILYNFLKSLHPWRKGPFNLFGIHIDSEWRSNKKWSRLRGHVNLTGKTILDIGCGNGYYLFRMLGAGAKFILGIDPTELFLAQFYLMKNYYERYDINNRIFLLPLKCEELPFEVFNCRGNKFDIIFSMGILYHRRNQGEHIKDIKQYLKKGGELILETLVIKGKNKQELIPENRYAKMRNVWSIPTVPKLQNDLLSWGFSEVMLLNVNKTNTDEQRKTEWMTFESLKDFLDSQDHSKTVEGYPAPVRAILRCMLN